MSWDLFVQDLPPDARSANDIPDDFAPRDLGPRDEVLAAIRRAAPHATLEAPSHGVVVGPGYRIEFDLGPTDAVRCVALHVRGTGDAVQVVRDIVGELGQRALDASDPSGIFDPTPDPPSSLRRWHADRDRAGRRGAPGPAWGRRQRSGMLGDLWLATIVGAASGGVLMAIHVAAEILLAAADLAPDRDNPGADWYLGLVANPVAGAAWGLLYGLVRLRRR